MNPVRTRFAPSPTGLMHVGNLRTALYAYLIARHAKGEFLLRIEDTDRERFREDALPLIYKALDLSGISYDEGPDKPGSAGPYIQSERVKAGIYIKYAKELVERGEAYYCFCDKDRLEALRQSAGTAGEKDGMMYDKHCLFLSPQEVAEKLSAGVPHVIRLNIPNEGETAFEDEIYGHISVPNKELDDMILIKSDGYPTYNFANVVDDHLMGITHVVRGNEYLSSAPKYNRLYEALGWEVPVYVHCPLITDEHHQKLSKRSGHASYEDLLEQGFLPEAVINFVALLGWSPEENRELFSLQELEEAFDYRRISKSPAVFDMQKLRWMNGEYCKAMPDAAFYEAARPYLCAAVKSKVDLCRVAAMVKTRIETLCDIKAQVDFIDAVPAYDLSLYTHKKMKTDPAVSLVILKEVLPLLSAQADFSNDALFAALSAYAKESEKKVGTVMWPIRTALSGKAVTPAGATELLSLLGKEESLSRLKNAVCRLEGAVSKPENE